MGKYRQAVIDALAEGIFEKQAVPTSKEDAEAIANGMMTAAALEAMQTVTHCSNCYGKGYSSYLNTTVGHDTDTDIDSPGGSHSRTTNEMKFCGCDRGKQLAEFVERAEKQASAQALFHYRADLMAENLVSYDADGSNCVWDYDGIGRMVVGDEDD